MKVLLVQNGHQPREVETFCIPRIGDHFVFDEYEEDDVEAVVRDVCYNVNSDDKVVSVKVYVEY